MKKSPEITWDNRAKRIEMKRMVEGEDEGIRKKTTSQCLLCGARIYSIKRNSSTTEEAQKKERKKGRQEENKKKELGATPGRNLSR